MSGSQATLSKIAGEAPRVMHQGNLKTFLWPKYQFGFNLDAAGEVGQFVSGFTRDQIEQTFARLIHAETSLRTEKGD